MSVELGPLGRQDEEGEVTGCTGLFEFGPELRSSVHLDARDREGRLGRELVEQGCGAERCGAAGDEADGPLGDGIISREVLDGPTWCGGDEEGVNLDEFTGPGRPHGSPRPIAAGRRGLPRTV